MAHSLTRAEVIRLADRCAPKTPAETLASIAKVESGFNPLTVRDNATATAYHPASLAAAVRLVADLMQSSPSVDVGLLQVNSRNFSKLGLTVESALDPCRNLTAAGRLLNENYAKAFDGGAGLPVLQTAYSIYNTGKLTKGFRNGYSEKVSEVTRTASAR